MLGSLKARAVPINVNYRYVEAELAYLISNADLVACVFDQEYAPRLTAVIDEDAHGVAVSSYQGGHMEYFKYLKDLLDEAGAGYVRIFGGGGASRARAGSVACAGWRSRTWGSEIRAHSPPPPLRRLA